MKKIVLCVIAILGSLEVFIGLTTADYNLLQKRIGMLFSPIGGIAFFNPALKYHNTLYLLSFAFSIITLFLIGKTVKGLFRGNEGKYAWLVFVATAYTIACSSLTWAIRIDTPLILGVALVFLALLTTYIGTRIACLIL